MLTRRRALAILGTAGIGTAVFRRALAAKVGDRPISPEMVADAEWIAGIRLTPAQREAAARSLNKYRKSVEAHSRDRPRQLAALGPDLQALGRPKLAARPARLSSGDRAETCFARRRHVPAPTRTWRLLRSDSSAAGCAAARSLRSN